MDLTCTTFPKNEEKIQVLMMKKYVFFINPFCQNKPPKSIMKKGWNKKKYEMASSLPMWFVITVSTDTLYQAHTQR